MHSEVPIHNHSWFLTSGQFIMEETGVKKVAHPEAVVKQRGDWNQVPNILIKGMPDDLMSSKSPTSHQPYGLMTMPVACIFFWWGEVFKIQTKADRKYSAQKC